MKDAVSSLGTILGIWAHPDDETFSSGGLVALARDNGQRVGCITATRGEGGVYFPERWPAATIARTRTEELEAAQAILGINEHHWLDFADGGCAAVSEDEALRRILPIIESFQPDTIVTFAADGITGHEDHKAVSRWARLAAKQASRPVRVLCSVISAQAYERYLRDMDKELNIFFHIDQPRLYTKDACYLALELPDTVSRQKCRALQAMPSQTTGMLEKFSVEYICQAFADEYFILAGNEYEI